MCPRGTGPGVGAKAVAGPGVAVPVPVRPCRGVKAFDGPHRSVPGSAEDVHFALERISFLVDDVGGAPGGLNRAGTGGEIKVLTSSCRRIAGEFEVDEALTLTQLVVPIMEKRGGGRILPGPAPARR